MLKRQARNRFRLCMLNTYSERSPTAQVSDACDDATQTTDD